MKCCNCGHGIYKRTTDDYYHLFPKSSGQQVTGGDGSKYCFIVGCNCYNPQPETEGKG